MKILFMMWFYLFTLLFYGLPVYTKPPLTDYSHNYYSQFGDDGVIEKIFSIIGEDSKLCVEFGANDGLSCSNTAQLWKNKGWRALLIESSPRFFEKLQQNTKDYYNCLLVNRKIDLNKNSIDNILTEYNIKDIDLMSIDIDGNDYYIFKSMKTKPRVIICEFNPTFPPDKVIYGEVDTSIGASQAALVELAKSKGYSLIAINEANAFFIINEELHKFSDYETDFNIIKQEDFVKYLVSDFSGYYCLIGKSDKMPWGIKTSKPIKALLAGGLCDLLSSLSIALKYKLKI